MGLGTVGLQNLDGNWIAKSAIVRLATLLIASNLVEAGAAASSERTVSARPDEGTFPVG